MLFCELYIFLSLKNPVNQAELSLFESIIYPLTNPESVLSCVIFMYLSNKATAHSVP